MPDAAHGARRAEARQALLLGAMLLGTMFLVVRPVAFQLDAYTPDAGLAGMLALGFALCAWGVAALSPEPQSVLRPSLRGALALWLGLAAAGLLHSPNLHAALPRFGEYLGYALLLYAGAALARARPGLLPLFACALVAMGCVEAFEGAWQKHVALPRLYEEVASGQEVLSAALLGQQGQERLRSMEIQATFGNANSYAAFLLVAMLVLAGLWLDARGRAARKAFTASDALHAAVLLAMGYGLWISGSKGAWAAAAAGAWFLFVQRQPCDAKRTRVLTTLTAAGVGMGVLVLALAAPGALGEAPLGKSMDVRFEYWRAAGAMGADAPLLGQGLCAFGDAYPQFKTALGTETQQAHNDWLQLWAELGVLAPLAWGLLWFVVLRRRNPEAVDASAAEEISGAEKSRRLDLAMLGAGLLGFLMLFLVSDALSFPDLWLLLEGRAEGADAPVKLGALAALLAPFIFAAVFKLLCPLNTAYPYAEAPEREAGLRAGLRAAIGAVLLHQLADFDLTAQAVIAALFLFGGMLASPTAAENDPPSRWRWLLPPLAALLLFPAAVAIPALSGIPRQAAWQIEDDARYAEAQARIDDSQDMNERAKRRVAAREAIVRAREGAFAWAPFDGEAALELAQAYYALRVLGARDWRPANGAVRPLDQLIDERLADAARLRPRWTGVPLLAGDIAVARGVFERMATNDKAAAEKRFAEAAARYARGADLYPLAPMFGLARGDALLLAGDADGAAESYARAWATDRRIADRNTRLSSVFHDPRPGCLPRHGFDREILVFLDARLAVPGISAAERFALRVRRVTALAALRIRQEVSIDLKREPIDTDAEILATCRALCEDAPDDPHARMFLASATTLAYPGDKDAEKQAWEEAAQARKDAPKESMVPQAVFDEVRQQTRAAARRALAHSEASQ